MSWSIEYKFNTGVRTGRKQWQHFGERCPTPRQIRNALGNDAGCVDLLAFGNRIEACPECWRPANKCECAIAERLS